MSGDNNNNSSSSKRGTTSSGRGRSSNATADSYIGSLISLTSKSEIRYEGVLYNINTDESSIGLENVRSFGTEGRKKDGPQIPPSDKVYEYILFRGSDIKDLQVKSSPPAQPTPPINNDPAIIQSHYPRPVSTSTSLPSSSSGSLNDIGSHNSQMGIPGSNFQGGLPLYQPGGSFGTWGASPSPPSANGSGFPLPMYWQGYYGPPNSIPNLHEQSFLRPPPGLSIPPSMQQPMQYPNFNAPLPTGPSNLTGSNLPVSSLASAVPDGPPPLLPACTSSLNLASTTSTPLTFPSSLIPVPSSSVASETLPSLMPKKVPSMSLPVVNLTAGLPSLSPLPTSSLELNPIVTPVPNKPNVISGPTVPYHGMPQSSSSVSVASTSLHAESPTPSLVTPGQFLQSGPTTLPSSQPAQVAHKDVEVVQVSSSSPAGPKPLIPVPTEAQSPLVPLPTPSHTVYKPNGTPFDNPHHGYRGSGRGRGFGSSRHVAKFTDDFDFEAMNEKFKKDEVWGHLGKSNNSCSKDKEDGKLIDDDYSQDEYDDDFTKIEIKSVYNKDDFFDTLSSNTFDHDPQNGRMRFSEQMRLDTETFGDFSRYRGGRGGRGTRSGRSRGSYYGRVYGYGGYGGWGRGRVMHSRSP